LLEPRLTIHPTIREKESTRAWLDSTDSDSITPNPLFLLRYTTLMLTGERVRPASAPTTLSGPRKRIVLALLLLAGTFMLLYKFPSVPVGLHQDEMSEAYESYSLLHTGADRWGYHLPVYFVGWGSGQNVLQAYLTLPVVAALGLTRFSARLVPILCGLLTLPLFFFTLRRWYGDTTALLGLFFLAFSPWHIMSSRLGIENSPLPFFMLLGVYAFGRALDSESPWLIVPSLIPFVLSLYTYGVVVTIIPFLIPLLLLIDPHAIRRSARAWSGAAAVFCIGALPIAFFTLKNYITKTNYAFERWLPFSVPLLPVTRLAQVGEETRKPIVTLFNIRFFLSGLNDHYFGNWFMIPGRLPIQLIVLLFAVVGLGLLVWHLTRSRRFSEPFLPWLIACVPLCFIVPLDISRARALFLPLIALGAFGFVRVYGSIRKPSYKIALAGIGAAFFLLSTVRFASFYYTHLYADEVRSSLYPELPSALNEVQQLAGPSMPIYITDDILLNYVDVLFLTKTDPRAFQHSGATYLHPDFGQYRFKRESFYHSAPPFAFLIKRDEPPVCVAPTNMKTDDQFLIGICP
jgi:4-amino-4-deoxy-L-arabinose transferase-like glycosyltransferase